MAHEELLVVGHDASRTGAPIQLLTWLRWAAATQPQAWRLVLLRPGPLVDDYAAAGPVRVLRRATRAAARLDPRASALELALERPGGAAPVVLANTVAAWSAAARVRRRRALVCWVHELDDVADALVPPARRAALVAATDRFVVAGRRVGEMVVERWGVEADRVVVTDPFLAAAPAPDEARSTLRILGAGALVPRKGADLFLSTIANLRPPLPSGSEAAWAGGPLDGPFASLLRHDLASSGLADRVHLAGPVADLAGWWPSDGIVLHPAREDPAPLVVLEAAARAIPVVTWDTGGAADLLRRAGLDDLVAEAGDVLGLADRCAQLLADRPRRAAAGRALQAAAAGATVERIGPEVWRAVMGAGA